MSEQDLNDPPAAAPENDWLVRLVRAPAGAVLLSGRGETPGPDAAPPPLPQAEPPPLPEAEPLQVPDAEPAPASQSVPPPLPATPERGTLEHGTSKQAPEPSGAHPPASPFAGGTEPTERETTPDAPLGDAMPAPGNDAEVQDLALDTIGANPDQPRRTFDPDELAALAASIAEQGVIQPVVVRPAGDAPGRYQLVVGERRWRAARLAGLATIPAVVRRLDDGQTAEIALVENIQRADLPPLEEARAYARLIDRHGHSQDGLARRVGKARSHIAHMLRLLRLPEPVQRMIADGAISVGHARLLVSVADPQALAERIVAEGLSVRQTEAAAKAARPAEPARPAPAPSGPDPDAWAGRFRAALDRPVTVKAGRDGGSVVIRYHTEDDLAAILARMGG